MREKLLSALAELSLKRPGTVLAVAGVLCVLSAMTLPYIKVSASRFELSEQDDQRSIDAFLNEFGSRYHLIGAVEAEDPDARHDAVDELVARLEAEVPEAEQIFYRIDPTFFRDRALLYLPTEDLRKLADVVDDPELDVSLFTDIDGLADMLDSAAEEMERATGTFADEENEEDDDGALVPRDGTDDTGLIPRDAAVDVDADGDDGALIPRGTPAPESSSTTARLGSASPEELEEGGRRLAKLLATITREMNSWMLEPGAADIRVLEALFESGELKRSAPIDNRGYLASRDGRVLYVFIRPSESTDRFDYVSGLTGAGRRIGADVSAAHPGVSISFTGYPAIATDDISSIKRDSLVTGIISGIAVMLLFGIGFRSLSGVLLAGLPLGMGILWSLGFIVLTLGGFNLLTQACAPVLAGLGIDFGVHLLGRYDGERYRGKDHAQAIRAAMLGTGKGILTGATTTAAAFLTMLVSDYTAFAQLGFITGIGLILVLIGTLTVLPALLTIGEQRGIKLLQSRGGLARAREARSKAGSAGDRFVESTLRAPRLSLGVAVLITVILGFYTQRVDFDYDMTALLPAGAESVVASKRMVKESDFSAEFLALVATDLDEVRRRTVEFEAMPMVARAESAATFIPEDQGIKVGLLRRLKPLFADEDFEVDSPPPADAAKVKAALTHLASAAEDAAFFARSRGKEAPALALDNLVLAARAAATRAAEPSAGPRLNAFQTRLFADLKDYLSLFRNSLDAEPIALEDLPEGIRERYVSTAPDGTRRWAVYAYPKGNIWEEGTLEEFVAEGTEVSTEVVGYPLAFLAFLTNMRESFYEATWFASIVIFFMLLADFRNLKETLLALVPLVCGAGWMVGAMGVFDIDYNLANIVALPLVLGIGVDNGVHLVHRRRDEQSVRLSLRRILRAVVVSSVTTMAGFAALRAAAHQGIQSFSIVMVGGVFACFVAALWILPALMSILQPDDEDQPKVETKRTPGGGGEKTE